MARDLIDVIDEITQKAQYKPREGVVLQVGPAIALVQRVGPGGPIPCQYDPGQGVAVNKRCVVSWAPGRKFYISGVFNGANEIDPTDQLPENFELSPPANLAATSIAGGILVSWSVPPQQNVTFELQRNASAVASGAMTVAMTRGHEHTDFSVAAVYFRVRSITTRWRTSSWSDWVEGVPGEAVSVSNEVIDDRVAALLQAGANVTLTYDDDADTLIVAAAGGTPNFGATVNKLHNSVNEVDLDPGDTNILPYRTSGTDAVVTGFMGAMVDGMEIIIHPWGAASQTVTLKHNYSGAYSKIFLYSGADLVLSGEQTVKLVYRDSAWYQYVDVSGGIDSVVAGTGIGVDNTDPANPVVSLSTEAVQDIIGAAIAAGANISASYNDTTGAVTIAVTGLTSASLSNFAEAVDDRVAALLAAGTNISLAYNDAGNALTIGITGQVAVANGGTGASDAAGARANLGAQAYDADLAAIAALDTTGWLKRTGTNTWSLGPLSTSDVSGLLEYIEDILGTGGLVGGANISISYNDTSGLTTLAVTGLDSGDLSDFASAVQALLDAADTAFTPAVGGDWTSSPATVLAALDELGAREAGAFSGDAGDVPYTPTDVADWTDPDPTSVQSALDVLAARPSGGGFSGDAGDVPFTPPTPGDWTTSPTEVEAALSELAARDASGFSGDAADVPFTPTTGGDWITGPTEVEAALDELAARPSGGSFSGDARDVPFTPPTPGDWTTSPSDVEEALSELAARPAGASSGLTPPSAASTWTLVNAGVTGQFTDGIDSVLLTNTDDTSANVFLALQSVTAGPFVMKALVEFTMPQLDVITMGVGIYDSGSQKVITMAHGYVGNEITEIARWFEPTWFDGTYPIEYPYVAFRGSRRWFKIEDDGTDFIFSWSNDGEFWVEFLSVANDDFLTTYDGVGIFVNVQYSGTPHRFGLRLLSWELT